MNQKNQLPVLEVRVLDGSEVSQVSGGAAFGANASIQCTCGTTSVCHIDGTTDADQLH